jgi:hypothetical protein
LNEPTRAGGAGLQVSEVVALKVTDIDSTSMLIRVEQGFTAMAYGRLCGLRQFGHTERRSKKA